MQIPFVAICLVAITFAGTVIAQATKPATRPTIAVGDDGFPSGHGTPEGVACDLARAFIKCDDTLFSKTCIRLYVRGKGPAAYAQFLKDTAASIKAAATQNPRGGPKTIAKVFAARHLSKDGPASYGYAIFGFQDVMFVDVGVLLQDGTPALNRTLVIQDNDGRWYVHPMPDASPLLSAGLNDEAPSERDFSDAYDVVK
jgi:hypothetical protein